MFISRIWLAVTMSVVAVAFVAGCGSSGGSGGTGGASSGSGGHGSGGTTASGGAGSGGATGSGGHVASGSGGSASGSGGGGGSGGHAVTGSGGSSATGSGGAATGGAPGSGGAGTASGGKVGTGGTASGGSGGAATGGSTGSGGMGTTAWHCPAASTFSGMSPFSGTTIAATRIMGAPPLDTFNNMGYDFTNVEGPVWIGDALYYSEMTNGNIMPPARILKLTADDVSSVFIDMSGSNGLATDGSSIFSANHGAQGIVKFSLPDKMPTTLVSMYEGMPFDSPNDLALASDGTIYFSDPNWQNSAGKQTATRVYQVAPGSSTAVAITDYTSQPNGISLSVDEQSLFVSGSNGVKKYAIANGQVSMTGTAFGPAEVATATDGMTLDCAGNLYVAVSNSLNVVVVKPDGSTLGTVTLASGMAVTNVAFGGADHQTLYVTGQGANMTQGVHKVHLDIPGQPY